MKRNMTFYIWLWFCFVLWVQAAQVVVDPSQGTPECESRICNTLGNAVINSTSGDTILLNSNTHIIEAGVQLKANTSITGLDGARIHCNIPITAITIVGNSFTTINNIIFDECTTGISLNTVITTTISNCVFINGGSEIIAGDNVESLLIHNCSFSNNAGLIRITDGTDINITSSQFISNNGGQGASLYITQGRQVNLNGVTFKNNNGTLGAIVMFDCYTSINVVNCIFENNTAYQHGGAIVITKLDAINHLELLIENSNFTGNRALTGQGGAIRSYSENALVTVRGSVFYGNYATEENGGAIWTQNTILHTFYSLFQNSSALSEGGAIFVTGSDIEFVDIGSTFTNSSTRFGGAVRVNNVKNASLTRSRFFSNTANNDGAGISLYRVNSSTLTHCEFYDNYASASGGAVHHEIAFTVVLENITAVGNAAYIGGGTYAGDVETMSILSSQFLNNRATSSGGGIQIEELRNSYGHRNTVHLISSIINGNKGSDGGGLYFKNMTAVVQSTAILFNNATYQEGGGIYIESSKVDISSSSVSSNNVDKNGGGIFMRFSNVTISSSNILSNGAVTGGGILGTMGSVNIKNSTIYGNTGTDSGGGIYIARSSSQILNTTISNNNGRLGGGVYLSLSANVNIGNSFILANVAEEGDGFYFEDESAKAGLIVYETALSNTSPLQFCCSPFHFSSIVNNTQGSICYYPACAASNCTKGNTCVCAPETEAGICEGNCSEHYYGRFCEIYDQCQNPNYCTGMNCSSDLENFTFTCTNCLAGYNGTIGNCSDINECTTNSSLCSSGYECINLNGTYNCTDVNECDNNPCDANASCSNMEGGYNCSCDSGFNGNGFQCRESFGNCQSNGGCDYHSNCSVLTNGSRICGGCPKGYEGNPYIICEALCGNGLCSSDLGENCVTCPADCPSPCVACGNLICDSGETVTSCPEDCPRTTAPLRCPGDCSMNGQCNNGICACRDSWGGPACNQSNSQIEVGITPEKPGVTVIPNTKGVNFTITIDELREVAPDGTVVSNILLTGRNYITYPRVFSASSAPLPGYCTTCEVLDYVRLVGGGGSNNKVWSTNTTLENRAYLEFVIWQFEEPTTTIAFADTTSTFNPNTLKLAFQIRNWPFKSIQNSLQIVLNSRYNSNSNTGCNKVQESTDNGSLRWFTININGVTLYGQFLNRVIIDGRTRIIDFGFNQATSEVIARLPHFWFNSVVDPSYSVLLGRQAGGKSECDFDERRSSGFPTVAVAIAVPVCVVVIAVVAVLVFVPKVRTWLQVKFAIKTITNKKMKAAELDSMRSSTALRI